MDQRKFQITNLKFQANSKSQYPNSKQERKDRKIRNPKQVRDFLEFDIENIGTNIKYEFEKGLEAAPRFELGMKVLQTLPTLGYAALKNFGLYKK